MVKLMPEKVKSDGAARDNYKQIRALVWLRIGTRKHDRACIVCKQADSSVTEKMDLKATNTK
jgi:hypothetical protein